MTNDEFMWLGEVLTTKRYTFAKTMPEHPHWYTLRWDWKRDSDFVDAVKLIRENGYERKFYGKSYTSFDINDSYYWTMGEPIDKDGKPWTYVLNKARRKCEADYDAIADSYDDLFTEDGYLDENRHVFEAIGWNPGEKVLDVGCGTGLFLEYNDCKEGYVGIDPSKGMLDRLVGKFGNGGKTVVCTDFERFYLPERFDKVVATFGSASYIEPETIGRVRRFLADNGEAFLMFYRDGYRPETYGKTNVDFAHHSLGEYMPFLDGCELSEYHEFGTERFKEMFGGFMSHTFPNGDTCFVGGVRAEESPNRLSGLTGQATYKHVTWGRKTGTGYTFYPIYDWAFQDVWHAICKNKWKYNRVYDAMYRLGVSPSTYTMRVSNLNHETAVSNLYYVQEIEPETWNKLTSRMDGIETVRNVSRNDNFKAQRELPFMFSSWQEYRDYLTENLVTDPEQRAAFQKKFAELDALLLGDPYLFERSCKVGIASVLTNDYTFTKIGDFESKSGVDIYRKLRQGKKLSRGAVESKYSGNIYRGIVERIEDARGN